VLSWFLYCSKPVSCHIAAAVFFGFPKKPHLNTLWMRVQGRGVVLGRIRGKANRCATPKIQLRDRYAGHVRDDHARCGMASMKALDPGQAVPLSNAIESPTDSPKGVYGDGLDCQTHPHGQITSEA